MSQTASVRRVGGAQLPAPLGGRDISVTEAARLWGVSRTTARKRLNQGRVPEPTTAVVVPVTAPCATVPIARRQPLRAVAALILAGLAVAIAWLGLRINQWYGASLGKTQDASALLAGLSISADALQLVLPSAALALWTDRRRALAVAAWAVWSIVLVGTLLAAIGFASVNIADTSAGRTRIADEAAGLAERMRLLQTERRGITEARSVASLEAEIQRAQPRIPADTWRDAKRCHDVTLRESGRACAELLTLRQALGTAQRRDDLAVALAEADRRLASLPAVSVADPQTDAATRLVTWMTAGLIRITVDDVAMMRIFGIVFLPQIAGLVMMFAMAVGTRTR